MSLMCLERGTSAEGAALECVGPLEGGDKTGGGLSLGMGHEYHSLCIIAQPISHTVAM